MKQLYTVMHGRKNINSPIMEYTAYPIHQVNNGNGSVKTSPLKNAIFFRLIMRLCITH